MPVEWRSEPAANRAAAVPIPSAPTPSIASGLALPGAAAISDPVHIQPLDLAGALQILIAEVRAQLTLPGDLPPAGFAMPENLAAAGAAPAGLATAPQTLVQMFLQALPQAATHEAAWLAMTQLQAAVLTALDKAMVVIAGWRDVPPTVVAAARETRAMVVAALSDDPPNPLWLRPEWLGLAPRMERFWRRRRHARRRLIDPDPHREQDEELEHRQPGER